MKFHRGQIPGIIIYPVGAPLYSSNCEIEGNFPVKSELVIELLRVKKQVTTAKTLDVVLTHRATQRVKLLYSPAARFLIIFWLSKSFLKYPHPRITSANLGLNTQSRLKKNN